MAKAFVRVPSHLSNYYLHRVESSFGSAYSTNDVSFRLKQTDASGNSTNVSGVNWTHSANNYRHDFSIAGTSLTGLHDKYVWVEVLGDGGANASGYTITLTWKQS